MSHFSSSNQSTPHKTNCYTGSLNMSHELSLDFKPIFIPKTINQFLEHVSNISNVTDKVLQVDHFINRLETETLKMEAFKQEVPLCMLLINDAIVALKEERMVLKKPVLEEFIPLKNNFDDVKVEIISNENENGDKKNWLSSTHLWDANENLNQNANSAQKVKKSDEEEEEAGRASFSPEITNLNRLIPFSTPNVRSNLQIGVTMPSQRQISRKQRRCWSTELHRRFVNALQQLGGSQAATPKQIRELMQVDGLTNDEVKSHLQKYRLHIRKPASLNTNQSKVVAGEELWMTKCSNSQSGSPNGPLSNGGNHMKGEEDEKSENNWWNSTI